MSEGGKAAAVRATVRLRVSLLALWPTAAKAGGGSIMPPAHAKPPTYRPAFAAAGIYISGPAPQKMHEPPFTPGPLLYGGVECSAIAAAGRRCSDGTPCGNMATPSVANSRFAIVSSAAGAHMFHQCWLLAASSQASAFPQREQVISSRSRLSCVIGKAG